jgi:hypothetical protein
MSVDGYGYIPRYVLAEFIMETGLIGLAIFLLGYVALVFGIEMAVRAFKRERFSPRGKWNSPICLGCIFGLLLLTWMPTIAWPMFNVCIGSLIWYTTRYELISISILIVLVSSFLILAALISIQLMRSADIDHNERIAASRMCYYLLLVTVVYVSTSRAYSKQD